MTQFAQFNKSRRRLAGIHGIQPAFKGKSRPRSQQCFRKPRLSRAGGHVRRTAGRK